MAKDRRIVMEPGREDGDAALLACVEPAGLAGQLLRASQACVQLLDLSGKLEGMNAQGRKLMEIDDFSLVRGAEWAGLWPPEHRARILEGGR